MDYGTHMNDLSPCTKRAKILVEHDLELMGSEMR